ncbi:MAG: general secretion pathway protein GspE [Myxococcaceae bacterium]|nr:general secretion pathway protein GspE [Myxococcaceae bacterium]
MARKRIGELLLERGVISPQQLEEGLAHHRATKQRLGVALIQKGFVTEDQLAQALGAALGIPVVDLRTVQVDWSAVHMLRARFCETNDLFPYALELVRGRKQLVVALSDPLNVPAVEEIEFTTGLKVSPRLASLSQVRAAVLRYYHKVNPEDAPEGSMTIIQRGGVQRVVPVNKPEDEDEEVIVGEEVPQELTQRTALADLIARREQQHKQRRRASKTVEAAARDLDFLFGVRSEDDELERLERKFWALMRIMARKGLITQDEFLRELDDGE